MEGKNANRSVAVVQAGQETRHRLNRTETTALALEASCLLDVVAFLLSRDARNIPPRTTDVARDPAFRGALAGTILLFRTRPEMLVRVSRPSMTFVGKLSIVRRDRFDTRNTKLTKVQSKLGHSGTLDIGNFRLSTR